jgi:hypothetical protein
LRYREMFRCAFLQKNHPKKVASSTEVTFRMVREPRKHVIADRSRQTENRQRRRLIVDA